MKKLDLGQTITILANVGVIAGIVFLAFELQQNNALLEAQARSDQLNSRAAPILLLLNNIDIAPLEYRASVGEPLSPEEQYYYRRYVIYTFIQWEWQYGEYRAGTLSRENLPTAGWRVVAGGSPMWRDAWEDFGAPSGRLPGFVEFMDENVFSQ